LFPLITVPQLKSLAGSSHNIDAIAFRALRSSNPIILSTIHVQDFPDVEGDIELNIKTMPIVAPVVSRALASIIIIFWSVYSSGGLTIGIAFCGPNCGGCIFFVLRLRTKDRVSYIM